MRALLTPEVAPRTGMLFKPGSDLMALFRGRVLITFRPATWKICHPAGLTTAQPLLDDQQLAEFFPAKG